VGCLTIGHIVGCLLQLDHLLVGEARSIVHDLHGVGRIAHWTWALGRLSDLATVNVDPDSVVAH
jgi:hypothetical protein